MKDTNKHIHIFINASPPLSPGLLCLDSVRTISEVSVSEVNKNRILSGGRVHHIPKCNYILVLNTLYRPKQD